MSRPIFFIVTSAAIFFLERVLSTLTFWPIFVFPIFVFTFILMSKDEARDLYYVIAVSLLFDFFSGFRFGIFTGTVLVVCLSIIFFKKWVNVDAQSFISTSFYSVIFAFQFWIIILAVIPLRPSLFYLPGLLLNFSIVIVSFKLLSLCLSTNTR